MLLSLLQIAAQPANAQGADALDIVRDLENFLFAGHGDQFSQQLLNQLFGPLFPAMGGRGEATIFSTLVGAINVVMLFVAGCLFLYNCAAALLQTAHEGRVMGSRWSSLWAPLRVLFAVALLIPAPGLGGYNVIQSATAWLVKGSTAVASSIWTYGAARIVSGDVPVTGSGPSFDAQIFATVYRNQLCMKIANHQLEVAGSSQRVTLTAVESDDGAELITSIGGRRIGICGSYSIPKPPPYVERMHGPSAAAVASRFESLHGGVLRSLIEDANRIVALQWPAALNRQPVHPDIADDVAAAIERANARLSDGNAEIMRIMSDEDGGSGAARKALVDVISGRQCDGGSVGDAGCSGQGWLSAGNWYMTIARLNSEVTGLLRASVGARESQYISEDANRLNRMVVGEAEARGWVSRLVRPVDASKYLHVDETRRIWDELIAEFENATARLTSLGFVLPDRVLDETLAPGSGGLFGRIWKVGFSGGVKAMIEGLSPSSWDEDPIVGVVNMGNWFLDAAAALIVGGLAASVLSGAAAVTVTFLIAAPLAAIGVTQSFVLPLLPFFYWIVAVVLYFMTVVEAVVGAAMWALSHLRLDGEGLSGNAGRRGWHLLLSLLLTPSLMVVGYFVGMTLFKIAAALLDTGLYYAMSALVNSSPFVGVFGLIATGALVVVAYMIIIERSFSLISEFPDRVMKWIGAEANLGEGVEQTLKQRGQATATAIRHGVGRLQGPAASAGSLVGRNSAAARAPRP